MSILVTRSEHDLCTRYLSRWCDKVLRDMKASALYDLYDLKDSKANKAELESRIKKLNPKLLLLNGHGNSKSVTGYNNEELIHADKNVGLLSKRITYAISCSCAKILGPKAVKVGAKAFIGYKDDFILPSNSNSSTRPLSDKRAKPFMEASNYLIYSLLRGHSAGESTKRSRDMLKNSYLKLLASDADSDAKKYAPFLMWNYNNLVCLGDSKATIS